MIEYIQAERTSIFNCTGNVLVLRLSSRLQSVCPDARLYNSDTFISIMLFMSILNYEKKSEDHYL